MKHIKDYKAYFINESAPTFNYDDHELHHWNPDYAKIFLRYDEIKNAASIDDCEAALLIAADDTLFNDIADYKYQNTPLPEDSEQRLLDILARVKPVDYEFYRGVEREDYDNYHVMKVQSWSMNKSTAELFGRYIYRTTAPCKGVMFETIYYWNGLINDTLDGFGDIQAEWFLLNPRKELI